MNSEDHLSNNFTYGQLTFSETAVRRSLDNTPNPDQLENLKVLAQNLERIRELLGDIHVNSAFRSEKVNQAVGGSAHSAHKDGYAADITSSYGSPLEVCKALEASGIPFDQIIFEGSWTHWSCDPRMRGETLTAHFGNGVTYTNGF